MAGIGQLSVDVHRVAIGPLWAELIDGRFGNQAVVGLAGVIISPNHFSLLGKSDAADFLLKADVDSLPQPLRASLRCANRFSVDRYPDRVGMRRRQDAQSDPTALFNRDVERNIPEFAVRQDF